MCETLKLVKDGIKFYLKYVFKIFKRTYINRDLQLYWRDACHPLCQHFNSFRWYIDVGENRVPISDWYHLDIVTAKSSGDGYCCNHQFTAAVSFLPPNKHLGSCKWGWRIELVHPSSPIKWTSGTPLQASPIKWRYTTPARPFCYYFHARLQYCCNAFLLLFGYCLLFIIIFVLWW